MSLSGNFWSNVSLDLEAYYDSYDRPFTINFNASEIRCVDYDTSAWTYVLKFAYAGEAITGPGMQYLRSINGLDAGTITIRYRKAGSGSTYTQKECYTTETGLVLQTAFDSDTKYEIQFYYGALLEDYSEVNGWTTSAYICLVSPSSFHIHYDNNNPGMDCAIEQDLEQDYAAITLLNPLNSFTFEAGAELWCSSYSDFSKYDGTIWAPDEDYVEFYGIATLNGITASGELIAISDSDYLESESTWELFQLSEPYSTESLDKTKPLYISIITEARWRTTGAVLNTVTYNEDNSDTALRLAIPIFPSGPIPWRRLSDGTWQQCSNMYARNGSSWDSVIAAFSIN